jgi:hypothetical protein
LEDYIIHYFSSFSTFGLATFLGAGAGFAAFLES